MPHRNFVTHLECSYTGESYEAGRVHGLSREGKPLLVRYDLEALGEAIDRESLSGYPVKIPPGNTKEASP